MADTSMRRGFLRLLVAAAAGGALVGQPWSARASGIVGVSRYTIALSKADAVVELASNLRPPGAKFNTITPEITGAMDDLLRYLLDNFDGEPDIESANRILTQRRSDMLALREDDLEGFGEAMVPLAILRELVRLHHVAFDTVSCPSYSRFVNRYASAILDV